MSTLKFWQTSISHKSLIADVLRTVSQVDSKNYSVSGWQCCSISLVSALCHVWPCPSPPDTQHTVWHHTAPGRQGQTPGADPGLTELTQTSAYWTLLLLLVVESPIKVAMLKLRYFRKYLYLLVKKTDFYLIRKQNWRCWFLCVTCFYHMSITRCCVILSLFYEKWVRLF